MPLGFGCDAERGKGWRWGGSWITSTLDIWRIEDRLAGGGWWSRASRREAVILLELGVTRESEWFRVVSKFGTRPARSRYSQIPE